MKTRTFFLIWGLMVSIILSAQPTEKRQKYDISKEKVLYTIGYAHLDTEWNWDYPATIDEYIRNIMTENFRLFEKYPDYVFNFTGSRRYRMMKEYYPDLYPKVKEYIQQGRWYVSGSSVDEGEVNISSSESLVRQVLYGNDFFRKEFGVVSEDYMLPDCFGFLANMPTIWHYCGLKGFSTQKLTWHSAVGVPFNVGIWKGPDGNGIIAALNATSYTSPVVPRLDKDSAWDARLDEDQAKYGISFDYRYYGVGDQGGAPRPDDVKHACGSLHNNDSKFKVILTASDQMYKDITPGIMKKLPVYSGDLLLIEHSAGSLTSQAYMKRMNRKNELLAKSAEELASFAGWMNYSSYPVEKLNRSWDLVLGSQFHDILPGTAIPKAYEYAWNDEFVAANGFAGVLKHAVSAVSSHMDTRVKGRAVVVYNPVARDREDVVTAELEYARVPSSIRVFDDKGKEVPSQVTGKDGNKLKFIFLAKVPQAGMSVYDVRESKKASEWKTSLSAGDQFLENAWYKVVVGDNGDITSIWDKVQSKELLSAPASLEFQKEKPSYWPSWNMDWNDRKNPPEDFMNHDATIRVLENGPVRVALEISRKGRNSVITQVLSLSAGDAGKRVEVDNRLDWQSKEVSLKAAFPLTVSNEMATYNLGVGTIQRGTNNPKKFEVPSKEWFDLTDQSGSHGVTVLEDCKYGSDKPDDHTLRLTLLYTPGVDNAFVYQGTQDWGIHEFRYGIYSHKGDWVSGESSWQGAFFNQPVLAFEAGKHAGNLGKSMSFLTLSSPEAGLMALKRMENGEYYIVRVNELFGKDSKDLSMTFPGKILDAYEVDGQEQKIGPAVYSGNRMTFDLSHYTIRSFAVRLASAPDASLPAEQYAVELPYNQDVMSFDDNRADGNFFHDLSLPAELIPKEITSEDVRFKMGSTEDEKNNAVSCNGQQIRLPEGNFNAVYILAAATTGTTGEFKVGTNVYNLGVQAWTGFVGQFYNRIFTPDQRDVTSVEEPFSKRDNIAWFASHRHIGYPSANDAYQYCYLYKYFLPLPKDSGTLELPQNKKIKILALTLVRDDPDHVRSLQDLYDSFKSYPPFHLREK